MKFFNENRISDVCKIGTEDAFLISMTTLQGTWEMSEGAFHSARRVVSSNHIFSSTLDTLLAATLVFNLIDMVLTLLVVTTGIAVEANPVMASLLAHGPVTFSLAKLAVVSVGVWVLRKHLHRPLAVVGSVGVFAVYFSLMVYHVQSLEQLLA